MWFSRCSSNFKQTETYSQTFFETFKASLFFPKCKSSVKGKLIWPDWEKCSQSCSLDGTCGSRIKVAASCMPEYAICPELPIKCEPCGCDKCPEQPQLILPAGSILSWVRKPNKDAPGSVDYVDYPGWIKCNGIEKCSKGIFKGQHCTDLQGRVLVGSLGNKGQLNTYEASLPNHHHPHSHTTSSHSHTVPPHSHSYWRSNSANNRCSGHSWSDVCNKRGYGTNTGMSKSQKTNSASVTVHKQSTLGAQEIDHGTTIGELYSKHMRVDFIFKCY